MLPSPALLIRATVSTKDITGIDNSRSGPVNWASRIISREILPACFFQPNPISYNCFRFYEPLAILVFIFVLSASDPNVPFSFRLSKGLWQEQMTPVSLKAPSSLVLMELSIVPFGL